VKTFPDRYYLDIGSEETLYGSDVFYFHPTLVFYRENTKQFGAYLFEYTPEESEIPSIHDASVIKGGPFLCGYHQGSYETIGTAIDWIREERGEYRLADWEVNFNILDQFVERDSSRFITEIQIPIIGEDNA
jgi:effector-binding domain-containing protein